MKKSSGEEEFSIVISEDDPDDQYLFRSACLEFSKKVRIHNVLTGRQLIQKLLEIAVYTGDKKDKLPSLIIAGFKKPFFELDIVKELRMYSQFRDIPVYLFSIENSESLSQQSLEAGATGFYKKPSTYVDLKRIVRELIGQTHKTE